MEGRLGTLEFCSALNGDDPNQVYAILVKFVKTVRKERIQAFTNPSKEGGSTEKSEDGINSDMNMNMDIGSMQLVDKDPDFISPPPSKKSKVEEWKLDSKSYNVPFVGTSTHKGSSGNIETGSGLWPTGFLAAYLSKSSDAMELLGKGLKKQSPFLPPHGLFQRSLLKGNDKSGKLHSRKLLAVFVQSVGEVVSCSIPRSRINSMVNNHQNRGIELKGDDNLIEPAHQKVVSIVMKEYIQDLFNILNSEAHNMNSQDLLVSTLNTFQYLACTSVGTAREVVRGFDTHLKDGILQRLASYNSSKKNETKDRSIERENTIASRQDLKVQFAVIKLATTLLEYNDATILSYIASPSRGIKESKVKAGILYLGVRSGLSRTKRIISDEKGVKIESTEKGLVAHQFAISHLLRLIREIMFENTESGSRETVKSRVKTSRAFTSLPNRALVGFIQGDILDQMVSLHCSPVKVDSGSECTKVVQLECKTMVTFLISDVQLSPVLIQLRSDAASSGNKKVVSSLMQQMNKTVQHLLNASPDMVTRKFVSRCFTNSPYLFPNWLRTVSIPDPKPSFTFLSTLSLIYFMLDNGPGVALLEPKDAHEMNKKRSLDYLVANVLPKALSKNILTKALQKNNTFLVAETLKLLTVVLRRFQNVRASVSTKEESLDCMADTLLMRLPDVMVLLSIRARFDPFVHNMGGGLTSRSFVLLSLCDVLRLYVSIFPESFKSIQFDWVKLLSESVKTFLTAPLILQHRILTTLEAVNNCYEAVAPHSNSMASPKGCRAFLELLLKSKNTKISKIAREIAIKLVSSIVASQHIDDKVACSDMKLEISLWIDALTNDVIPYFCQLLETGQKATIQHSTIMSNAWSRAFPSSAKGTSNITPLLPLTFMSIASGGKSFPDALVSIVVKITSKLLLTTSNPQNLASLVKYAQAICLENESNVEKVEKLETFASTIIDGRDRAKVAHRLATSFFGNTHFHSQIAELEQNSSYENSLMATIDSLSEASSISSSISQCLEYLIQTPNIQRPTDTKMEEIVTNSIPTLLQEMPGGIKFTNLSRFYTSSSAPSWIVTLLSSVGDHKDLETLTSKIGMDLDRLIGNQENGKVDELSRYLLLFTATLSRYNSSRDIVFLTTSMIHSCLEQVPTKITLSPYFSLLICNIQLLLDQHSVAPEESVMANINTKDVFDLWLYLSKNLNRNRNEIIESLILRLQDIMEVFISKSEHYGFPSSVLMTCIYEATPVVVVELVFQNVTDVNSIDGDAKFGLLVALMMQDVFHFGRAVMNSIVVKTKNGDIHKMGFLAEVISVFVRESIMQQPNNLSDVTLFHNAIEFISEIVCGDFDKDHTDAASKSIQSITNAIGMAHKHGILFKGVGRKVLREIEDWLTRNKKSNRSRHTKVIEESFFQFLKSIGVESKTNADSVNLPNSNEFKSARNAALVYAIKMLPKTFRNEDNERKRLILETVITMLESGDLSSISCLQQLVIICLKLGIGSENETCIQIVRLILTSIYGGETVVADLEIFSPGQIQSMIFSHSHFEELARRASSPARKELLALLVVCISLDQNPKECAGTVNMSKLLVGFRGSIADDDRLLRRLFYLYEVSSSINKNERFFMHNMIWGDSQQCSSNQSETQAFGTDHGHHWEWFIEVIDVQRVRKTISDFPIMDPARPPRQPSIESWLNEDDDPGEGDSELSIGSSEDDSSIDFYDNPVSDEKKNRTTRKMRKGKLQEWQTGSNDDRYSPGFIVPLILGVLESFAELADHEDDTDSKGKDSSYSESTPFNEENADASNDARSTLYRETFTKVAYRLSQKGAIALSVMALSSKCPELRKIAASVIYRFIQALRMEEAHGITAWRSRPQINMVVCSLQRGLMVSRARRLSKNTENGEEEMLHIPMLPAVSALFLARSLMIIPRPAESMYGAINKFYLRLDNNGGAYADCFSLPGFMTLFGSVQEDTDLVRRERLWILHLLKDGTLDSYCYKVAAGRHAPELLLSFVDAMCSRNPQDVDEYECLLLLDTISVLVERGGASSFFHYFIAVGLLSWIQSTLENIIQITACKSLSIAHSYLKLIIISLKKIIDQCKNQMDKSDMSLPPIDALRISRGALDLFMVASEREQVGRDLEEEITSAQIGASACSIISLLYQLGHSSSSDTEDSDSGENQMNIMTLHTHPYGIPTDGILKLIESSCKEEGRSHINLQTMGAFCSIPMNVNYDDEELFCQKAIECILASPETAGSCQDGGVKHLFSAILERVAALNLNGMVLNSERKTIGKRKPFSARLLNLLLGCNRKLKQNGLIAQWLHCLTIIIDSHANYSTPLVGKGGGVDEWNAKKMKSYRELLGTMKTELHFM
eukprot:CAMPEP_0194092054 /NCGR_PEP_ID=MMETSP0149-20130528/45449_1 /TAXON_ID=122233 /ORGANISM="Chaetoceros debilis, Strain MM31A-1" /LENGTH=2343 /DNA_ID=CAMNT_0038776869 /DNA_START=211 /DNA_END=7242 /DNA_ORIENTATION=+